MMKVIDKLLPPVLHQFEIDVDRWSHGTKYEMVQDNALRLANGKMCCLGFLAKSCGVKVNRMLNVPHPYDLKQFATPKMNQLCPVEEGQYHRIKIDNLIDANDLPGTLVERKRLITKIFRELGIVVKFYSGARRRKRAIK